jgi:predicted anti-sigma-YlaC factor YlaD
MNCSEFNDQLQDYLDQTAVSDIPSAAREHLQQCAHCRRAFLREEALSKSIRHSLGRATAGISLRPDMHRDILKALSKSNRAPASNWMIAWQRFIALPVRLLGAGVALLGLLLLFLVVESHRKTTKQATLQAFVPSGEYTCIIDVPIHSQTHVFRRQNNTVVDAIVSEVTLGHAEFH